MLSDQRNGSEIPFLPCAAGKCRHCGVYLQRRPGRGVLGLVAAYLLWMELVPDGPQAISITERLFERELGQVARELVAMVERCDPSSDVPVDAFVAVPDDEIDTGDDELDDG